ncbi:thioesterase family protein [Actinomycetospora cinnamomea]|uniref:Putative thioesterase n=1 Tax=Actinomycetospora cinnamomea TaxID=663609 RepID=A0A2U1F0Z2_9PSEU|nr:hotdog domain-containing protein [Actinomycetospora cinnamomea]PVZ05799.1 putative thioesterase [Actinomycetospora cinnamomea]
MRHEVTADDTAVALGSGEVEVLGTPRLVAWFEAATVQAARDLIGADETTVGSGVRIRHRRPTLVGGRIEITAELRARDGARLTFAVHAEDGHGQVVGDGEIDRAVVDRATFG